MADFKASLSGAAPAPGLDQDEANADGAWVHAHLHRVEGDLGNAGYWYRQANKPVATDAIETEWERMVLALLGGRA